MMRMEFCAGNNPRFAKSRQAHGLGTVELGILECCNSNELSNKPWRKSGSLDIQLIRIHQFYTSWKCRLDRTVSIAARWCHPPWLIGMLVFDRHADAENAGRAFRLLDDPMNRLDRDQRQG
ncbi:MAG: hypothetical protein R3C97_00185 [Geminicoccaceae bacterium]